MIDLKLTPEDKKAIAKFTKPTPQGKPMFPKEKIGDKIPKDFNPRKG